MQKIFIFGSNKAQFYVLLKFDTEDPSLVDVIVDGGATYAEFPKGPRSLYYSTIKRLIVFINL